MTKQAFLEELNRRAGGLSEAERARLVDYYREMIEDRVEEGIPEEEAVAALGDPAALAEELAGAAPKAAPEAGGETVSALSSLRVQVANADVVVVREALENGAACQLRFSDPSRFEWRMDGDTLEVREIKLEGGHRGLEYGLRWLRQLITEPELKVTIALSGGLAEALDFQGGGSDLRIDGAAFAKARLVTASGDITLRDVNCAGGIGIDIHTHSGDVKLEGVHSANLIAHAASGDILSFFEPSGDIFARSLALTGRLRLESASGDIQLRASEGDALSITTASGDIEADRCRFGAAAVRAASGDVRLVELESDPTLAVDTASGDVELCRCIAREARINTASGDVERRLEPLPCGYDLTSNTVSGSVHFDDAALRGAGGLQPKIGVRTVSGDIEARLA